MPRFQIMAYVPVETLIQQWQKDYYQVLAQADRQADATPFIEFMLHAIKAALEETDSSDQVSDQASDQVKRLLKVLANKELKATEIMDALGLSHRPTFRKNYLNPALEQGLIERTQPDKKRSPQQRYRLVKR